MEILALFCSGFVAVALAHSKFIRQHRKVVEFRNMWKFLYSTMIVINQIRNPTLEKNSILTTRIFTPNSSDKTTPVGGSYMDSINLSREVTGLTTTAIFAV